MNRRPSGQCVFPILILRGAYTSNLKGWMDWDCCSSGELRCSPLCLSLAQCRRPQCRCFPNKSSFRLYSRRWAGDRRTTYGTNITMHDIVRVDVCEGICGLVCYLHAIRARMETNVMEDVPIFIIWSHDGGHGIDSYGDRRRPSG
jgi:hypothetical protein